MPLLAFVVALPIRISVGGGGDARPTLPITASVTNEATQTADPRRAVATVFSVMRNVSVPIGIKIPGQPNIADTLWLTVSDQKIRVYYFQDTNSPSVIWTNLARLEFSEGSRPRKLPLDGNPDLAGDQTANYQPAELFQFMSPDSPH